MSKMIVVKNIGTNEYDNIVMKDILTVYNSKIIRSIDNYSIEVGYKGKHHYYRFRDYKGEQYIVQRVSVGKWKRVSKPLLVKMFGKIACKNRLAVLVLKHNLAARQVLAEIL